MAWDAVIIGSRIAGSATAIHLARGGYRVLLVDRATFPSDTISTHIVWQRGVERLMKHGLLDAVIASQAPRLDTAVFDFGSFALRARLPSVGAAVHAYAPRRKVLDKILLDAATRAGAEVREGFRVDDLLLEGDRVVGIRGRSRFGGPAVERARFVIGADGVHSTVARILQPAAYNVKPTLTCWYYSYWSGVRADAIRFYSRPQRAIGCIPTNDSLVCVIVAWPRSRFREVRADIESHYLATFEMIPQLREELLGGKREERFYGTADIPNYFRKPFGPGWALVGDAGYHKDPILAQGISDALRDASLLADAINQVLTGRAGEEEALGLYEKARNVDVEAIYELTAEQASLQPPAPEIELLIQALRGNQEEINRFAGTVTGAIRADQFFAPSNVQRIINTAGTGRSA